MTAPLLGQDDPQWFNLEIIKGADFRLEFNWTDDSGGELNLAGSTMTLEWDRGGTLSAALDTYPDDLTSVGPAGISLTPGTDGDDFDFNIVWTLTASQTADLSFYSIPFRVFMVDGLGQKTLWAEGRARLVM